MAESEIYTIVEEMKWQRIKWEIYNTTKIISFDDGDDNDDYDAVADDAILIMITMEIMMMMMTRYQLCTIAHTYVYIKLYKPIDASIDFSCTDSKMNVFSSPHVKANLKLGQKLKAVLVWLFFSC